MQPFWPHFWSITCSIINLILTAGTTGFSGIILPSTSSPTGSTRCLWDKTRYLRILVCKTTCRWLIGQDLHLCLAPVAWNITLGHNHCCQTDMSDSRFECRKYHWARHFSLTVPFSPQASKWVPVNLMLGGNPACNGLAFQPGRSRNTPSK